MNEHQDYWSSTGSITLSRMTKTDLHNLVEMGETAFVEFKQKVASPEKLAREIAAFANCDGGMILI